MAFDVEGYRKAAKEAGLSDEEIQKDIDEETQGVAAKGADANMTNVKVGQDFMGIPEWLQPAAAMTAAGLIGAGATGLGMKLKDRKVTPEQPSARVEPTFGIPDIEAAPQAQPQNKFTPPQGDVTDVVSRPVGSAPQAPAPAPVGVPQPAPQVAMPGAQQPQMQYGATTTNAPTGVPSPIAPPPEAPVAAVQPKPMTEIERLRLEKAQFDLDAARAKEARAQEAHAARLASEAKRAEAKNQTNQGKPVDNVETAMQKQSHENAISKAVAADVKASTPLPKAVPAASVVPPAAPVVAAPVAEPVAIAEAVQPPAKAPKAKMEMPEGWGKGMSWLVNQHGIEGAQDFVNRYNDGKPFATYDDMMKSYQENTTRPKYSDIPKDVRKSRGIAPPKQSGVAGKAAGVAGAALLLPTIGEAAQATKEGDTQKARANIMEWLNLHPVGAIANQLFGTSPEELETLRKGERSRKIGAGRGIAPPSAYQR